MLEKIKYDYPKNIEVEFIGKNEKKSKIIFDRNVLSSSASVKFDGGKFEYITNDYTDFESKITKVLNSGFYLYSLDWVSEKIDDYCNYINKLNTSFIINAIPGNIYTGCVNRNAVVDLINFCININNEIVNWKKNKNKENIYLLNIAQNTCSNLFKQKMCIPLNTILPFTVEGDRVKEITNKTNIFMKDYIDKIQVNVTNEPRNIKKAIKWFWKNKYSTKLKKIPILYGNYNNKDAANLSEEINYNYWMNFLFSYIN